MYIHARVNPIVLSRGRRFEESRATVFPIPCRSKPPAGSDEAIGNSPRRDFQHFQFAQGSRLPGEYTRRLERSRTERRTLLSSGPRIERLRIQMRRNDHSIQTGCCTPPEDSESLCFPRSESLSDISIAQNVSAL